MKKKRAGIFLAHNLFADQGERGYLSGISAGLRENFGKIGPLIGELRMLGFSVDFLVDVTFADKSAFLGQNVREYESRGELYSDVVVGLFDVIIVWNGFDFASKRFESWCDACRIPVLYLEYGFFLQKNYIRFDFRGLSASSTWPPADLLNGISARAIDDWSTNCLELFETSAHFMPQRSEYIDRDLVVLQTDYDSSLVYFSPFPTAFDFLEFLKTSGLDFDSCDFRIHPNVKGEVREKLVDYLGVERIDGLSNGLVSAFLHRRVLGVNSTLLAEAVCIGRNPIAFGMFYGSSACNQGYEFLRTGSYAQYPSYELKKMIYFAHQYLQFHEVHGFSGAGRAWLHSRLAAYGV